MRVEVSDCFILPRTRNCGIVTHFSTSVIYGSEQTTKESREGMEVMPLQKTGDQVIEFG